MATRLGNQLKLLASAKPATVVAPLDTGSTGMGPPDGPIRIPVYSADMTAIGNTIDRTFISLDVANPSNGTFNFANRQGGPDLWYTTNRASGRKLIIQPIFSPAWWQQGAGTNWPHSVDGRTYADMPPFPGADWDFWLSKCALAATAYTTHYNDNDIIWEPGNEWNNAGIYHRPGGLVVAMSPANYAAYFAAQYTAGKAVNPNQKWIIGGLFRMDSAPPFSGNNNISGIAALAPLKTALDALGVTPDGVSIHPYMLGASNSDPTIDHWPSSIGVNSWQSVGRCLAEMDRIGWHLPVYITETGFRASGTNGQNAFNCGSEATKSIWNLYEHHSTYFQYSRVARGPGKAYVAAILYYRDQDYPASLYSPSLSGCLPGDPDVGPHALTTWGAAKQDFNNRIKNRLPIPKLEGITLTGVPSTVVVGAAATTISAAGTNMPCIPGFVSSNPAVVSVTPPATGASSTTIQFLTAGTVSITARSMNAVGIWIVDVHTIDVQAPIATSTTMTPGSGFKVATENSGTILFVPHVLDQLGNPMAASGTFTSSDPTNFPVDPVTGLGTAVGLVTGVTVTFTPDTGTAGGRIASSTGDVVLHPVLQITNAPTQLLNFGAVALTVTDGVNPVTGFTINISDPTKATVSAAGSDLVGKGTSGTFNLTVSKTGLTTSSINVVTCTGGASFDDKDLIGQTDNTAISTYTDSDGIAWVQASGTLQPFYHTNVINGHSTIRFNGTNQYLRAAATHPRLNGTAVMYMALIRPTKAAPSANEQIIDNRDTVNSEGFVMGRNASAPNQGASVLTYYTAPGTTKQEFDGTKMTSGSFYRDSLRIRNGKQERMINGVIQSTVGTDATYRFPTHSPHPTKGGGISGGAGNNFEGDLGCETMMDRTPTDAEWLQADYYQVLYITPSGINPATLDHLTLLISSTTATVGSTVPTLTVQAWADSAETTASTATLSLSYSSGTPGTATINSGTGVITLVAAGTTVFTVTDGNSGKSDASPSLTVSAAPANYDTTSYNTSTGAGIFGSSGAAPQTWDTANRYTSDTDFRSNISSGPSISGYGSVGAGTGTGSSRYNDGQSVDLIQWQTGVAYGGQPTWQGRIVGDTNLASSAPSPILRTNGSLLGSIKSGWMVIRRYFPAGWTSHGDAVPGSPADTFNITTHEADGYKSGPFAGPSGGRAGMLITGNQWLMENVSGVGGLTESGATATVSAEWTDDSWYDYAVHLEEVTGTNGHEYLGSTMWERKIGAANYTRLGFRRMQDIGAHSPQYWTNLSMFGENYNMGRSTNLFVYWWGWAVWNDTVNPDPLGILAQEGAFTPATPTVSSFTGKTSSSATFTVGVGRFSNRVVPVVDGVEQGAQSFTLPPEIAETDPAENSGYLFDPCPISRTVTGLATGLRTISFNVYNANGSIASHSSNTTVTI